MSPLLRIVLRFGPLALLLADAALVALHGATGWPVFDLDQEANLPTWYSSAKLLLIAGLAASLFVGEGTPRVAGPMPRGRSVWLLVSLLFVAASADETGSLHERAARTIMKESEIGLDVREILLGGQAALDSFAWVAIFSPVILGVAIFLAILFYRRLRTAIWALPLALAGLAAYLAAVGLESTIYFLPSMAEWAEGDLERYRLFTAIEEAFELLGTTLLIAAFARYRISLAAAAIDAPAEP